MSRTYTLSDAAAALNITRQSLYWWLPRLEIKPGVGRSPLGRPAQVLTREQYLIVREALDASRKKRAAAAAGKGDR